ncbi:MAG TPA: helix-turn-helix transcriptional regulator [Syntrophorhabdus sp.]|jgi:transcriptional regulator with XRE-family HTH domain|nr:helix-turn-helix transcriptional regulator [Syntrophorhabdus sp.]HPW37582.1 helix-turn-helix transcriptional regulator [Syntrophorhabdus sp.]
MNKNFFLKEILDEKGIKQRFIARKMDVSVSTVSLWVLGKTHPTIPNLKKLAAVLEVDVDLLVNGKKEWHEE